VAGTNAAFDAAAFRDGIHLAMAMGLPPAVEDQPTFHFPQPRTYGVPVDEEGVPYDPTAQPLPLASGLRPAVKVPCAVEYFDVFGEIITFGIVTPSRVVLTLLDTEFVQVDGFTHVDIGQERYVFRHWETPLGLFEVGVRRAWCLNENEQ
jgi:hypothetical protein